MGGAQRLYYIILFTWQTLTQPSKPQLQCSLFREAFPDSPVSSFLPYFLRHSVGGIPLCQHGLDEAGKRVP